MNQEESPKLSRRKFCALGAAAVAMAAVPSAAALVPEGGLGGRCRLTVVRRCSFVDLQSCWKDDPDGGACDIFKDGQEIEITPASAAAFDRGEGFCPHAWQSLRPYVVAMLQGSAEPKQCSLMRDDSDIAALVSCPDGARPVIFALSAIRE